MATNRFLAPSHIVMHPRRWAWFLSALDTTSRPLVVPNGNSGFNAVATAKPDAAQGVVGGLMGLDVVADPSIPTNLGGGTEDTIIVLRAEDVWLFESTIRMRVLPDVGSGTLTTPVAGLRLHLHGHPLPGQHQPGDRHRPHRADLLVTVRRQRHPSMDRRPARAGSTCLLTRPAPHFRAPARLSTAGRRSPKRGATWQMTTRYGPSWHDGSGLRPPSTPSWPPLPTS